MGLEATQDHLRLLIEPLDLAIGLWMEAGGRQRLIEAETSLQNSCQKPRDRRQHL